MKIGILIPEFPGQTHIFFQREVQALARRGIEADIVSTRRPPPGVVSHSWASESMRSTWYLSPLRPRRLAAAIRGLALANPRAWASSAASWARAQGLSFKGRMRLAGAIGVAAELAGVARARDWSHLHCHSCGESANLAMFCHLLTGIPYSLTLHGELAFYGPNQPEKWRHAAFGLVVARRLLDQLASDLSGSLPSMLEVAPMGVDLRRFQRSGPYVPWRDGPLRIFSCGRLNFGKGHADLLRAMHLLRARGVDARLVIAGEDDAGGNGYHLTLNSLIAELGLTGSVILLGAVNEARVVEELQAAHVFSLASYAEGLTVATMEAMAMQVPVVVTRVGGVPELVDDGVDGLLVPPSDPNELARQIADLVRDPERASAIAEAGRRKVEHSFSSERGADVLARCIAAGRR